ncbi:MAG: histidine phosphatase family protein [Deltaproteobacteria bacterium]|nr:histidine phosphatase family protein [Deltaproteobacteria bacterium]
MSNPKLYIVMVGLPARGKSTIAVRLKENLMKDSIKSRIFNNGDLRRKMISENTSFAAFYNPDNREGKQAREEIALINLSRAKRFLSKNGDVAILDATNASLKRRAIIKKILNDHPILFIECINNDQEILDASIIRKVEMPEFSHLNLEEAVRSFKKRISYYENIYSGIKNEKNFIRLDSLNNKILREEIGSGVPYYDLIRDFLVTDTVKNLYLIRHGETFFNLENRIGGDSDLTEKGKRQACRLAEHFRKKRITLIFTSSKRRTLQTASPINDMQGKCSIIPLKEFDEIDSGLCECMSYDEIRKAMPEVYNSRKKDKYNYIYPGGEGYCTMKGRIDKGIKKALYLSNTLKNIMIIGHRATNRMILSHFLFRRDEDVPYIYVPQDRYYYISASQYNKQFILKRYEP